jgi:hypothetical protein
MFRGARVLAAIVLTLQPAWAADGEATAARRVYTSGPDCPAESEFWAMVATHLRNPSALDALPVRVELVELEGRAQAKVAFGSDGRVDATRELSASTCGEAAQAAALVVALALDARVDEQKPVPPPAPPARPIPQPRPTPPRSPDQRDSAPREVSRGESGLYLQLGGGALAQQALAPSPLIGVTAFAGIGDHAAAAEARLGVVFAQSGTTESDDASAEFSLLAGQLEACAFAIVRSERFVVDPCFAVEVGRVVSRGIDSARYAGEERSTLWAALGPLLRARHAFSQLWLEAYGGPWIPVAGTREFVFQDPQGNRSFHEVAPVGLVGGLGLALRLD